MNSSKKIWAGTCVFVLLVSFKFVADLLPQTSNPQNEFYLLIKENLIQKRSPEQIYIEKEFFRIFFDQITELKNIAIVNSKKTIMELGGYDSTNNLIPKALVQPTLVGNESLANCDLNWKWDYDALEMKYNTLEIIISEKGGNFPLAFIKFIVPSDNKGRLIVFRNAIDILLNQLLSKEIKNSNKDFNKNNRQDNRDESYKINRNKTIQSPKNIEVKYFLLIETSFTFKYFTMFFKLKEIEKTFFRVLFDSISNKEKIKLVNSERVIRKLGGYDSKNDTMPKNLKNSDFIGNNVLVNYLLEWSFRTDTLRVNILKKDNDKKYLVYGSFVVLPLGNKPASYQDYIKSFVSIIIKQLLENKI